MSDSERHGTYWKVQCSGIGQITRITGVLGGSRETRLTADIIIVLKSPCRNFYP
jgi:hypothetical protein